MKKLLKVLAVLLGIVIVVLIGASIALHIFLPPEKAKALVLKQLSKNLKREVTVKDASVGIFSGLTLSNLAISESPTFSKGTFLSSDEFQLNVSIVPLLFKKVVIRELDLRHPQITIIRYADGKTFNFSDLMTSTATTPAPVKASAPAPQAVASSTDKTAADEHSSFLLLVSRAVIDKGVVHFVDRSPAKQSADLDPINLSVKNVSPTSPFTVETSLTAKSRGTVLTLNLVGEADLLSDSFSAKRCTLASGGSSISMTGNATHLRSGHPTADLHISIGEFNLGTIAPWVSLPPGVQISGPLGGSARVKGDEKTMNFSSDLDFTNMDLHDGRTFSKPAKVPMSLSIEGVLTNMQRMDVQKLGLVLSSLKASGHGKISGLQSTTPELSFHLETNTFAVDDLLKCSPGALPRTLTLSGTTKVSADITGTMASNQIAVKWQGKELAIAMGDQFSKPSGVPLEVSLIGEITQPPTTPPTQQLEMTNLTGTLGPVQFSGKGSYKTVGKSAHVLMNLKTNMWSLQEFSHLVPMLAAYKPMGQASLNVQASGSPDAPAAAGSVVLQNVGAHYQQSDVSAINTVLNFSENDASTPRLSGKLNGSEFTVKFAGHHLTTQPDISLDAAFAELNLDKLLPPPAPAQQARVSEWVPSAWAAEPAGGFASLPMTLSGHATVGKIQQQYYKAKNLDIKWNLTGVTPDLSRVGGTATLRQGAGNVTNVEQLAQSSKFARLLLEPLLVVQKLDKNGYLQKIGLPTFQSIPFDSLKGDYTMQAGVMTIQTFVLDGRDLAIQTQGTVGLAGAQPLNLQVVSRMAPGSLGGTVGQLTNDASGRPTVKFSVTGTVANPSVKLDLADISHKAVQQGVQQLLKGFGLGGGGNSTSDADSNQQNTQPSMNDIQKKLKNIFH